MKTIHKRFKNFFECVKQIYTIVYAQIKKLIVKHDFTLSFRFLYNQKFTKIYHQHLIGQFIFNIPESIVIEKTSLENYQTSSLTSSRFSKATSFFQKLRKNETDKSKFSFPRTITAIYHKFLEHPSTFEKRIHHPLL